ncbi:MAG: AMP-binding protein [Bacteroidota bacterium]
MEPSAHRDPFARDHLPPHDLWPDLLLGGTFAYPPRLNCAVELLERAVDAGHADRPLFRTAEGTQTYAAFLAEVNRIAHVLVDDLDLVPGNRVLLRGPNTPRLAACWFAVVKAGGICVTTMPLLRSYELTYTVEKARVSHALCDARFRDELGKTQGETDLLTSVAYFYADTDHDLEARMASKPDHFEAVDTAADDVVLIGFTSGTTGKAKATAHFHRDVLAICDAFPASCLDLGPDDIVIGSPPLAFTFGLGGDLLFPMRVGASCAFIPKPSVEAILQTIHDFGATVCFTSPTAYRAMLDRLDAFDVSSLRQCVSAGEPLPAPTFHAWHEATGIKIIDGIGSTEMLHIFLSAPKDQIKPGTTGKPIPGYEAKVVDENGNEVPPGTVGLLAVRGPTGCRYLDDPERQRTYVRDGWNYPGDAYLVDDDGYFHYQSRTDDMIITSGYNVSGLQVESVLLTHDAVGECGVVGVPDEARGHLVKAFIVLREGVEASDALVAELQDFVKAEIAPYKYPRAVAFLDALPRTQTGKLQRFRLRDASLREQENAA